MQNNIQHRITGLLNAYKRNRRWKILTIILSVAVLCNTFYAMRQAAVAVTEQNAETSQIDQILGIEGQQTTGQESVAPGTGGSIETVPAPTPTPVATDSLPTTPVGTDPATTDPTITGGGEATTDPAVIPETGATDPSGTGITGSIGGLVVPEGEEVILPADAYGTTPAEYDEYGNPIYPEEAPIEEPAEIDERVTLETYVGETLIQATFMSSAFENEVWLEAELITEFHEDEQKRNDFEKIKELVEEAAANSDKYEADGFAVFDIRFRDVYTWEEVEPLPGENVQVVIDTMGIETPVDAVEVLHVDDQEKLEEMNAEIINGAAEFETDSFSYYIVVKGKTYRVGDIITSASPSLFTIKDTSGRQISSASQYDLVSMEIGWDISNPREVRAGSNVVIRLPQEFSYPDGDGEFVTNKTISGYPAGTPIAVYTLNDEKKEIVIVYLEAAANLANQELLTFLYSKDPWAKLQIEGVRVSAKPGQYNPAVSINNQSRPYGSFSVSAAQEGQLTDVKLTSFLVNGESRPNRNYPLQVGIEDPLTLDISWEWKSLTKSLVPGDWYEIELDAWDYENNNVVNMGRDKTVLCREQHFETIDRNGNEIDIDITTNRNNKSVIRITYKSIGMGYNESSGRVQTNVWLLNEPDFVRYTIGVMAKTGTSRIINAIKASEGSVVPDGVWRTRTTNYSNADFTTFKYSVTGKLQSGKPFEGYPSLYVMANHGGSLYKNPLDNVRVLDFDPSYSHTNKDYYLDVYCISPQWGPPAFQGAVRAEQYDLLTLEEAKAFYDTYQGGEYRWNSDTINRVRNIMSVAFPYAGANGDSMRQKLGYRNSINNEQALVAVQVAIWKALGCTNVTSGNGTINAVGELLYDYKPTFSEDYRLDGDPSVVYNDGKVTVTGKLYPGNVPEGMKGVLSLVSDESKKVDVRFTGNDGSFTATLENVTEGDAIRLRFEGEVADPNSVYVMYFRNKRVFNDISSGGGDISQDMVGARVGRKRIDIEWSTEGKRSLEVVKEWYDSNGDLYVPGENATEEATLQVYRYIDGQEPNDTTEPWQTITLNKGNNYRYSWAGLPIRDDKGNVYRYKVTEKDSPSGFVLVDIRKTEKGIKFVFTASNRKEEDEKTKVKVRKEWAGVPDPAAYAVRVQLFAVVGTELKPVYIDRSPSDPNNYTRPEGQRTLSGQYFFEGGTGRYEVIVFLNGKPEEGWDCVIDKLPAKWEDDTPIQYLVKEISAGPKGHATDWEVTVKDGTEWAGDFVVTYSPISRQPDMTAEMPTVTVTNTKEQDVEITIVKADDQTGKRLQGAKFDLYVVEGAYTGDIATTTINRINPENQPFVTDANGEIKIGSLKMSKYYYLKEVEAPTGYVNSKSDFVSFFFMIVEEDGKPVVRLLPEPGEPGQHEMVDYFDRKNNKLSISVSNKQVTYELPEAGGVGTKGYMAGGMSLITATLLMYMTLKFMQKTRKRGASK